MHANRNKKAVKRVEKGMMKANRIRNLFAVFAIVLTTFMITTVFSLGINYMENMKLMQVCTAGTTANASLAMPTEKQEQQIKNLEYVKTVGTQYMVGSVAEKNDEGRDLSIALSYYDPTEWEKHYKETIKDIDDGVVKLRPPLDLNSFEIEFFFGDTYALDIKWSSKNGIKTFQAEEFKSEKCKISRNGKDFFPTKYLHAEFDMNKNTFRHFDGAIHFYTSDEYYQRRDSDFNHNNKNSSQLKTLSLKLFKVNGLISIDDWTELTSQYLTGNPLVFEYFEEKFPDHIQEFIKNRKN